MSPAGPAAPAAPAPIGGPEKAAIALLSLDEEVATAVLARLADDDVRRLVEVVKRLDEVGGDVIAAVLEELERGLTDPLSIVRSGGAQYVRKLADRAFGADRAQQLLGLPPPPPPPSPAQLLRTARVSALSELLADEHPQIAAVVITQLPPPVAAKVLTLMPPPVAADLTARISELDELPEHAVAEASQSLLRALEAAGGLITSDPRAEFDGLAFSAAIVNELPVEAGDALLGTIAERDEQAAGRIREAMFTFEDLLRVSRRELGALVRSVQSDLLITALQTATPELREHLLGSVSSRAGATLRDDLAAAAPRRLAEVEEAQHQVVDTALRLAGEGKLKLPARGGE